MLIPTRIPISLTQPQPQHNTALSPTLTLTLGGSGDWFDVHDTAIMLDNYKCVDVTKRAHMISRTFCTGRVQFNGRGLVHRLLWPHDVVSRCPQFSSLPADTFAPVTIKNDSIYFGTVVIVDLTRIEQRVRVSAYSLGVALSIMWIARNYCDLQREGQSDSTSERARKKKKNEIDTCDASANSSTGIRDYHHNRHSLMTLVNKFDTYADKVGFHFLIEELLLGLHSDSHIGESDEEKGNELFRRSPVLRPRGIEIAAALNRLRGLKFV